MSRDNRPPHRTFGRLSLEELESRDVPSGGTTTADFWWFPGTDGLSTTASNWLKGPSIPYGVWTRAPGPLDRLHFDGDLSDADCLIPSSALPPPSPPPPGGPTVPNTYGGLLLTDGYTGVVSTAVSLGVGSLQVDSGTVRQNGSTSTSPNVLTVNTTLTWTGGTLNDASVAGEIDLAPGATGTATPTDGGTVNLGSVMTLMGTSPTQGAQLTLNEGEYQVNCDLGFNVLAGSLTLAAPVPKAPRPNGKIELNQVNVTTEAAEKGLVTVKKDGKATIEAAPGDATEGLPGKVVFGGAEPTLTNWGTTTIKDSIDLEFSPSGNNTGAEVGLVQRGLNAKLSMEAGTAIICNKKTSVNLLGGQFELVEAKNGNGVPYATQSQVTIAAPDHVDGDYALTIAANVEMNHANATVAIPLYIKGTFLCRGNILMYADQSNGLSDTIRVKKQIVFDEADLTVSWFVAGPCYNTHSWPLITSEYSDTTGATVAISGLPTYHLPPAAGGGLLSLSLDSNSTVINFTCTTP